ncbi:MAG: hypothetical protein JW780_01365 [Clostridiales bacterium]|nr:hypothetical protein [Clostridiales bacterium]
MTERLLCVRSSFVKVGNKRRPAVFLIVLIFVLLFLSGCNQTGPQDPVPENMINDSPENVARVYSESVFTGNYLMMFKTFPREFIIKMREDDLEKTAAWGRNISDSLLFSSVEFHGTSAKDAVEISDDKQSFHYRNTLDGIVEKFDIDSGSVADIYKCDVSLFFEKDGADKFQTVSVVIYQYEEQWFVYEMEAINVQ